MIKRIELFNFKGETGEYELTGKDMFVGPNGSGKTRILEAIELALTGSVGRLGTVGAIYQEYGNGAELKVVVDVNDLTISRTITKGRKKVTPKDGDPYYTVGYSGDAEVIENNRAVASGSTKVNAYLEGYTNTTIFNWVDFLNKNSSDKRAALLSLIGYDEPMKPEILNCMAIESHGELFTKVKSINDAIEVAEKERKYYNRKQKESAGAGATNTEIKNSKEGNVRDIKTIETELEGFIAAKLKFEKSRTKSESIIKQMEIDCETIAELDERIQEAMALDFDSAINQTQQQIMKCIESIKEVREVSVAAMIEKNKEIEVVNSMIADVEKLIKEPNDKAIKLNVELETIMKKINSIESFDGVCPVVGIKCTGDIKEGLQDAINASQDLLSQVKENEIVLNDLNDKLRDLETSKAVLRKEYDEAVKSHDDAVKSNDAQKKFNAQMETRKAELEKELNDFNLKLASHSQSIASLNAEKKALLTKKYDEFEDINVIDAMLTGLDENIKTNKEALKQLNEKLNAMNMQQEALAKYDKDRQDWEDWKETYDNLNKLKADKMKSKLEPIKIEVDKILIDAGYDYTFDFVLEDENGKDQLTFGWTKDGFTKTALSSGEQLLTSIGILKCIQANNQVSLLLIDEVMLLDNDNLDTLMNLNLEFDNVILLSPRPINQETYKVTML